MLAPLYLRARRFKPPTPATVPAGGDGFPDKPRNKRVIYDEPRSFERETPSQEIDRIVEQVIDEARVRTGIINLPPTRPPQPAQPIPLPEKRPNPVPQTIDAALLLILAAAEA